MMLLRCSDAEGKEKEGPPHYIYHEPFAHYKTHIKVQPLPPFPKLKFLRSRETRAESCD